MNQNFKKVVATLLSLVMCLSAVSVLAVSVSAETTGSKVQKGEFVYAPHTYMDGDLPDIYYYSDDFFKGSALDYNEHLATMSMILAASSISSQEPDAGYDIKSQNLSALLRSIEFDGFRVNEYYTQEPKEQTMGVGMAYRVVGEGEDAYTILAIVPRSAGYKKEWAGNFTVGKTGVHQGFATGRDIILDFAESYVEENIDSFEGEVKIWTVGYSRGAGVANLLAAHLVDDSDALGIEVKQENIFAYTFGTPSTVQYANEAEKASLEENYRNIHNRYAEYDIVTYAPFKNWNFTYYGTTKLFDVHNAEKKAEMLKFLEKTNKTIYDLYTAENSSADPDNFTPLMLQIGEGFSINFVPADPSYGIPADQKAFLDSRIDFLIRNLVPDRAHYVDGGFEYALQCLTSLYFGLDAEQGSALLAGMSHDLPLVAAAYYCYFLVDYYLNGQVLSAEQGSALVSSLNQSLLQLEQYVLSLAENEEYNTAEWYQYVCTFIKGEEYGKVKALLTALAADPSLMEAQLDQIRQPLQNLAYSMTARVLSSGISALTMEEKPKQELLAKMTDNKVTVPLTQFFVYLLLGYDDGQPLRPFNPSNQSVALAVTFAMNAGRYMRVHNNEIILSWLRTEDSYYANEDWHVHNTTTQFDATGHWGVCECGYTEEVYQHAMSDWEKLPATEDGKEMMIRRCPCGYEETREAPAATAEEQKPMESTTVTVIVLCVAAAIVVAVAITAAVVVKKRKANKA